MFILGVKVDEVTKEVAGQRIRGFLQDDAQHTIFTPNPEMLMDAQKDKEFRDILNSGSLNICDGKGIELMSRGKLTRIPGIDFMLDICRIAAEEGRRMYLLGSRESWIVEKTKKELERLYPGIRIVGAETGPEIPHHLINVPPNHLDRINQAKPDILFVAFGHGKQEKWIHENLPKLPSVKIAMGVGGAFDMLAGKSPRAPRFLRAIGLEWLWRLIQQPWRIGRIWKATGRFLFIYCIKNPR